VSGEPGFKRLHHPPRASRQGGTLRSLTTRGAWLLKQSEARYLKRDDAYGLPMPLIGEIGRIESVRFISTGTPRLELRGTIAMKA
jgi:hypothetical protein